MIYNIRLIERKQQQTSKWAGGITTQLAIYPDAAVYSDRNFLWRLSSAVVELEESVFTSLPGFDRHLMVLEGELKLIHEGQHTARLKRFQQDSFKGGWNTVSIGKARDYNLMLREGLTGGIEHYSLSMNEKADVRLEAAKNKKGHFSCYAYRGSVEIQIGKEYALVQEGSLLLIEWQELAYISVQAVSSEKAEIITASIIE